MCWMGCVVVGESFVNPSNQGPNARQTLPDGAPAASSRQSAVCQQPAAVWAGASRCIIARNEQTTLAKITPAAARSVAAAA